MKKHVQFEKFAAAELTDLRKELQRSGVDSWQAAELVSAFLSGRGYGVAGEELRTAALRTDSFACSIQRMQEEFEKVAFYM
jgi:hypothetical protein